MRRMKSDIFIGHHSYGLKFIGAWPGIARLPGFHCAVGIMLFFLIFEIWNITVVYGDLEVLMDNLVSTIGVISGLFKMMTFWLKRRNLMLVISKIFEDWDMEHKEPGVMAENCMRSQLVSKMIIVLYNSMNCTYFLRTVVSYLFDAAEDRKFLAQVTFPFDSRQSPFYEVIVLGQFITASICFNSHALIEGLLAILVLHTCSKVDLVRKEIMKFSIISQSNYNNKKLILMALRNLTEKHLKFIEFSENIQDVFSYVSFFHIFLLTLMQVVSGYMFIDALERGAKTINLIHYAILTISFLVSSGYYCIAGEYLTSQSEIIFNELYNCSWYKFSNSNKKAVNFMLVKARKPVTLTVGKFNNLSLLYLTSIMKTSFSYLSLVRAVR